MHFKSCLINCNVEMMNIFFMLTCHIVLLGTDLHLSFVDILDYSYAAQSSKSWTYWNKPKIA